MFLRALRVRDDRLQSLTVARRDSKMDAGTHRTDSHDTAQWRDSQPGNPKADSFVPVNPLGPSLKTMDNLSSHKGPKVRKMIEDAGAQLLFLPPYSPDFNPIELAFAKLKARLRKAAERTVDGLWNAIGQISLTFSPQECKNYFNAAGYSAT